MEMSRVYYKDGDPRLQKGLGLPPRLQQYASYYIEIMSRADRIQSNLSTVFGSFEEATRGWTHFGVNRVAGEKNRYVVREWLENARRVWIFGEFNGWQRRAVELTRDNYSTFEAEFTDQRADNKGRGTPFKYR